MDFLLVFKFYIYFYFFVRNLLQSTYTHIALLKHKHIIKTYITHKINNTTYMQTLYTSILFICIYITYKLFYIFMFLPDVVTTLHVDNPSALFFRNEFSGLCIYNVYLQTTSRNRTVNNLICAYKNVLTESSELSKNF